MPPLRDFSLSLLCGLPADIIARLLILLIFNYKPRCTLDKRNRGSRCSFFQKTCISFILYEDIRRGVGLVSGMISGFGDRRIFKS